MAQSIQISKEIKKSLQRDAPEILDSYESCMKMLEDIEIHD